ncbi:MAG: tRNA (adenosine(37)-N6)-threonylcarbamoyltransferase complex ATPase subunit type 1 TsaE [Corallococcus sp.]|nr:tRNA (adenosine(37)-N6)-threonylcarbamoyltransferase complex ATPase subunit type 1 TsaE [Corallococcus sp.]MCM1359229.1 tRNA (adenosine(37)-N6)-threonylcarbamoyltransferase complex ATPase subunit type 1 TsaE [Corallococcus sp.]MCM1394620.1 tRNA (adenosine(37)-N6)-threonylcarbamoyltransferase complex ATPase subunit type 1 TsaE [Corallococcus sp.]
MLQKFVSKNVEETERIAENLGKMLSGGETILLCGDLGAGKTHFVKGLALALGIDDVITSPTFSLHNVYHGRDLMLNHFDFYRLESSEEAELLGLNEYFGEKYGVSAIEWSENVSDLLPKKCIVVTLKKLSECEREITVVG